jgi:putative membrane protein
MVDQPVTAQSPSSQISVELSSRNTGMAFQRTRLSAERTLMSVIRTALSLISFGFTITQFFVHLKTENLLPSSSEAPRRFGISLVILGATILAFGIWYHADFMLGLRKERRQMTEQGIIHGESRYPVSVTFIVAVLLLLVALLTTTSMLFHIGPYE